MFLGCLFHSGAHCDFCNYICPIDYEALHSWPEALFVRHQEDVDRAAALKKCVACIVRQYAIPFSKLALLLFMPQSDRRLSELFVAWDDAIRVVGDS